MNIHQADLRNQFTKDNLLRHQLVHFVGAQNSEETDTLSSNSLFYFFVLECQPSTPTVYMNLVCNEPMKRIILLKNKLN
nr:hypothetical protein [Tanacetum cinerariifolium]